jgi:hypothetical protein
MNQPEKENNLDYLFIINQYNEPLLFKSYRASADDLNIQLHSYACLDFLDEKVMEKGSEYLGQVYTILNLSGEYSIFAFYTVTRMKFLAIFKQKNLEKYDDEKMKNFFLKVYKLYRKELYQPFENLLEENKFSRKFYAILDSLAKTYAFK